MGSDGFGDTISNNIPSIGAGSRPDAGILAGTQNANNQLIDAHGNHVVVCDYCVGVKISIIIITPSKLTILLK